MKMLIKDIGGIWSKEPMRVVLRAENNEEATIVKLLAKLIPKETIDYDHGKVTNKGTKDRDEETELTLLVGPRPHRMY